MSQGISVLPGVQSFVTKSLCLYLCRGSYKTLVEVQCLEDTVAYADSSMALGETLALYNLLQRWTFMEWLLDCLCQYPEFAFDVLLAGNAVFAVPACHVMRCRSTLYEMCTRYGCVLFFVASQSNPGTGTLKQRIKSRRGLDGRKRDQRLPGPASTSTATTGRACIATSRCAKPGLHMSGLPHKESPPCVSIAVNLSSPCEVIK